MISRETKRAIETAALAVVILIALCVLACVAYSVARMMGAA